MTQDEKARLERSVSSLDLSLELFCALRRDGLMVMRNEAWERFLGYFPEEFSSLSFFDLLHPDDRGRLIRPDDPSGETSLILGVKARVRRADGVYRQVEWSILPARESGVMYVLGRDTAESDSAAALASEIDRLHHDIDMLGGVRDSLDLCVSMQEASQLIRRFCRDSMGGRMGEVWISNSSRNLLERIARWGDGDEDMLAMMEPVECWGMRSGRAHFYDPNGAGMRCKHLKEKVCRSFCTPLKGTNEIVGLLTTWEEAEGIEPTWHSYARRVTTISEVLAMGLSNLAARETLRSQSIRDPLTALYNRRFMEESLDRELARATRHESFVGLIILDPDNFKRFNDEFGHRAGDTALIEVGSLLRDSIRTEDVACRYGGEEFAVIMPGAPLEATTRRAEGILEAVRSIAVRDVGGKTVGSITMSAGISHFPDHGATSDALVEAADIALFAAKNAGRDCVRVAPQAGSDPDEPAQAG
ncbi:MAG: sensor domain-containing diguanylate cyclase [Actinomycetota bacterium]